MRKQKINDINFLLAMVERYLETDMSPEIKQTHQTLVNIKMNLMKQ